MNIFGIVVLFVIMPVVIIHLIYKNRKNKDKLKKIIYPVLGIIIFFLIFFWMASLDI